MENSVKHIVRALYLSGIQNHSDIFFTDETRLAFTVVKSQGDTGIDSVKELGTRKAGVRYQRTSRLAPDLECRICTLIKAGERNSGMSRKIQKAHKMSFNYSSEKNVLKKKRKREERQLRS